MYSIIQAFGINYAENSSIIKQIKKPETGDTAGSPSEGMDSVGSLDPAERPQRKGGTVCNSRHAQKRPRPDGSEELRPLSPASAGLSHLIGSPPPSSKPCCPCQASSFTRDLSSAEQPSFVRARGAHWGWSGKAGVRTGLRWSRHGCQGEGTAEPPGCQGHREPSLALVKAPGLLLLL